MKHATTDSWHLRTLRNFFLLAFLFSVTLPAFAGGAAVQVDAFISGLRDLNDQPLAGGYVACLTTSNATATIWLDRGKLRRAPNPVYLDSFGRAVGGSGGTAQIYADGLYNFRVYDASGTLQYTVNNLEYTSNVSPSWSYINAATISSFTANLVDLRAGTIASAVIDNSLMSNGSLSNCGATDITIESGLATFTQMDSSGSYINLLTADQITATVASITTLGVNTVYLTGAGTGITFKSNTLFPAGVGLYAHTALFNDVIATGTHTINGSGTILETTIGSATVTKLTVATPSAMMDASNKGYVDLLADTVDTQLAGLPALASTVASLGQGLKTPVYALEDDAATTVGMATGTTYGMDSVSYTNTSTASQSVVVFANAVLANEYSGVYNGNLNVTLSMTNGVGTLMSRWAYAALTSAQPSNHQLIAVDVIGPGVSRTYSVSALATTAASFKVHSWPLDKRIIKLLVF